MKIIISDTSSLHYLALIDEQPIPVLNSEAIGFRVTSESFR